MWKDITHQERDSFNELVSHHLQSYEWGEFREKTGITILRKGFYVRNKLTQAFQLSVHPIPCTTWSIGYLPKGNLPTKEIIEELKKIGKEYKCIFIQQEPHAPLISNSAVHMLQLGLCPAAHPLFAQYNMEFDLTKSEEELLEAMHPSARYDIRLAQKRGVVVEEINIPEAIDIFWPLMQETMKRKHFYAHSNDYYHIQWASLPHNISENRLSCHLLCSKYLNKPLTAWIVLVFKKKLYATYSGSSSEHRELQHSSLMVWEVIRFGKKHNLDSFDLGGVTKPNSSHSDFRFGYTRFKESFGPKRIAYIGSYDLVFNPFLYKLFKIVDKFRWYYLNFICKISDFLNISFLTYL